jgi:predicted GNAT family acetyltransferase
MSIDYEHIKVKNNEAEQRYEIRIDDQLAVLRYERNGNQIVFTHTQVPPALEGHGLANKLAHTALEDAQAAKLTVVPLCPFVAQYIREHSEYLPLLSPSEQTRILQA